MALQVQQRTADYASGTDMFRDQQTYLDHYWDNSFWGSFWSMTAPDSANWLTQMRILKIHCTNAIAHLQGSMSWFPTCTRLVGDNGKQVTIALTISRFYNGWRQEITFTINGQSVVIGNDQAGNQMSRLWQLMKPQLYAAWYAQAVVDPPGKFMAQDYSIINAATPNASVYQLVNGGSGQPDSSYLSLLTDPEGVTEGLGSVPVTTPVTLPVTTPFDQAYAALKAAGAIIPPDAVQQPSDAITALRLMYQNSNTSPIALRDRLLQILFNDLLNGSWSFTGGGNPTWVFSSLTHSTPYYDALKNYIGACNMAISYFQDVIGKLTGQLASANQMDLTTLSMVQQYRDQRAAQAPMAAAITTSQAREIFNQEVGPFKTISLPEVMIYPVAYMPWIVGPPWSETPCFPTFFGCVPNPLYYTIVAQLIRGLDRDGGEVTMPQNLVQNTLKNVMQQEIAVQDIIDLSNKKQDLSTKTANLALLQEEKLKSYGDASMRIATQPLQTTISSLPVYNSVDTLAQSVMSGINTARQNSEQLAQQQQDIYNRLTGTGTLIERAALQNEQQALKAAALEEVNRANNARTSFKAMIRNEALQTQKQTDQLQEALDHN